MTNYLENTEVIRERNKRLLTGIRNLPSVPFIMVEVSKMLDNPRTGATDLGKLISKDQAMVAKILSVANSPLYGLPRRVSTIEFAIVILGFDHIKNIVIALSMMEAFKSKEDKNWNRRAFWLHSLITASAAKELLTILVTENRAKLLLVVFFMILVFQLFKDISTKDLKRSAL